MIPLVGAWVTMMFGSILNRMCFSGSRRRGMRAPRCEGRCRRIAVFLLRIRAHVFSLFSDADRSGAGGGFAGAGFPTYSPDLIVQHTPIAAQIIFRRLAVRHHEVVRRPRCSRRPWPSVKNIVKSSLPTIGDRGLLAVMRTVLVGFAALVLLFALNLEASIFKMVESAYKTRWWWRLCRSGRVVLVARDDARCHVVIVAGLATWLTLEWSVTPDQVWPPQLVGMLVASGGMVVGCWRRNGFRIQLRRLGH